MRRRFWVIINATAQRIQTLNDFFWAPFALLGQET